MDEHPHPPQRRRSLAIAGGAQLRAPVSGLMVDSDSPLRTTHEGRTYVFCHPGCLARFRQSPASFLEPKPPPAPSSAMEWTCPMHPEIVRDRPGACPICGMALGPRTITAAEPDNPELRDMQRRFWVCAALSVPLVVLGMGHLLPGELGHLVSGAAGRWVELLLASAVVLWGGWPFFARAWESIRARSPNMFTLIGLGVGVAYGYSVVAALAPQIFPASRRDASGRMALYFEPAAVIVTLVLLGQVLELRARSRSGAAIRALLGLQPNLARRVRSDGSDEEVPIGDVRPGDLLRVR